MLERSWCGRWIKKRITTKKWKWWPLRKMSLNTMEITSVRAECMFTLNTMKTTHPFCLRAQKELLLNMKKTVILVYLLFPKFSRQPSMNLIRICLSVNQQTKEQRSFSASFINPSERLTYKKYTLLLLTDCILQIFSF